MREFIHRPGSSRHPTQGDRAPVSIVITPGTIWLAAGIVALFVGIAIVLVKAILVFILFFVAIIFAEGLRPAVDWLERRHVPRAAGVLLIYLTIIFVLIVLGYLLIQPLMAQVGNLNSEIPAYSKKINGFVQNIQSLLGHNAQLRSAAGSLQSSLSGSLSGLLSLLIQIPLMIGSVIFAMIIVVVMAFFWLTGVEHLKPFFVGMFPEPMQENVSAVLSEMGHRVGGYVRGVGINMLVIGTLSGLINYVLGVPYPVLLGIFAGITELIPYFGPWIGGAPAVFVAFFAGGPILALEVVLAYIIIQEIEGHTLVPFVMMRAVKVNPLTVVISVLLGTELLGIVGGILAVPAATIIHVLMVSIFAPAARKSAEHVDARHVPPIEPENDTSGSRHTDNHGDSHTGEAQQASKAETPQ